MLEGMQLGTIDVAAIGSAPIGGMFEPLFQALDLPFFWSTRAQVWKVMDGPIGQDLLKKMEARGVKGLCFGGGWASASRPRCPSRCDTPRIRRGSHPPEGERYRRPPWSLIAGISRCASSSRLSVVSCTEQPAGRVGGRCESPYRW
jgi:hypothetical protein